MTCKIYFIQCLETGEVYIGSTNKKYLSQRIADHKFQRNCSCIQILDRGNYVCDILEEVEESQRYIREQYYIGNTDNCINKHRAFTDKKEYNKQYRLDNKDKFKQYNKEWKSQKYTCECGSVIGIGEKSRHLKTIKHRDYLKTIR